MRNKKLNLFVIEFVFIIFIILSLFSQGCSKSEKQAKPTGDVLASVNDSYLDEQGLKSLIPPEFYDKLTTEHKKQIVEEWVDNELLYQEALGDGIDKEPEIAMILNNARRNLLSNELLERKLSGIAAPDDKILMDYYNKHKDYFILEKDEYSVRYALFESSSDAKQFWRDIKAGGSFSTLAQNRSKHFSAQNGGDLGIISEESVEPEIWDAVEKTYASLGTGKISEVFNVAEGYALVIIDQIYKKGSYKPFQVVKNQVMDFYMTEKREETKKELISKLSKKSKITYNLK